MALILNIESATDICSVALGRDNNLLAICENKEGNVHSEKISLLIDECMQQAGLDLEALDAIALSRGPGSYTSLRVGSAVAKGICYALNKRLIVVDTLETLARASFEQLQLPNASYIPMIDARRMEVYMAIYDADQQKLSEVEARILNEDTMEDWKAFNGPYVLSGSGAEKSRAVLKGDQFIFSDVLCSAAFMLPIAQKLYENNAFSDMAYFSPMYFKAPNITVSKKKTL